MPFRRSPKLSYSPTAGEIFQLSRCSPWSQPARSDADKLSLLRRTLEQFARGAAKLLRYFAAEHPRDFLGPIARLQNRDAAPGRTAPLFFFDSEMTIGEGGDLRQVSDAQDLMKSR